MFTEFCQTQGIDVGGPELEEPKMSRKLVVVVSVVVLALLAVGTVSAQGGPGGRGGGRGPMWGDDSDYGMPGMMGMMGGMMMRGGYGGYGLRSASLISTVADLAGIEVADVQSELSDGATLAEVLEAHDVSVDALKEALLAGHAENLAAAVADGDLTQAQADAMQALMAANLDANLENMLSATWSGHMHGRGWNRWSPDDSSGSDDTTEEAPLATPQASS